VGQVSHIEISETGQRIDNFLLRELKPVPRSRIYQMLRKGEVRVNGGRVKPTYRLTAGDRVRIPPVTRPETQVNRPGQGVVRAVRDSIIHQDPKLIVLNKPSGIAVHGGSGISTGVIETLRTVYPGESLELVHRLDKETSGCLLVARKRSVLRELHQAFRNGMVQKRYQMLVHGQWRREDASIRAPLTRYLSAEGERRVRVDPNGKIARTDFRVLHANERASWLEARLHTGRTHQIRVHAASRGHPLLGEEKYGSSASRLADENLSVPRLVLHATLLQVKVDGETMRFACEPPGVFAELWERLV
jgi:23S rRNA pseudouridine955/2504/2580 synthase